MITTEDEHSETRTKSAATETRRLSPIGMVYNWLTQIQLPPPAAPRDTAASHRRGLQLGQSMRRTVSPVALFHSSATSQLNRSRGSETKLHVSSHDSYYQDKMPDKGIIRHVECVLAHCLRVHSIIMGEAWCQNSEAAVILHLQSGGERVGKVNVDAQFISLV